MSGSLRKKEIVKGIKNFLIINIGIVFLTVGVYFFKIPNGFSTGGVSGIGTVLGKVTPFSAATVIMAINMILLFIGFVVLGKSTGLKTVYCSLMFSAQTWLLERFMPLEMPLSDQPLLELVYAILLTSVGSALLFNYGTSSGGTDIVALILKKYTSLDTGKALLCTDFIIAASSFFAFGITTGLFSMLGLFAKAFLVDSVLESLNCYKYFMVITDKPNEVNDYILKSMHRGSTVQKAVGAFTNDNKVMIHTVCKRIEAIALRNKIRQVDPQAFVIITTSSEIIGRGFRSV